MSRYQSYEDCKAVCPYYKGARGRELMCDGVVLGNYALLLRFTRNEALQAHRARHCDCIRGYERCPLYRIRDD